MAKGKQTTQGINGVAEDVQRFVRGQLLEAQRRVQGLEQEAQVVIKNLVLASRQSRRELEVMLQQWGRPEWLDGQSLKSLTKRAGAASAQMRRRWDELQQRIVQASGVATQSQIHMITKELARLSRTVDGLVGKKPRNGARS